MKVTHFQRRPVRGQHSIEALFGTIQRGLREAGCQLDVATVPFTSRGIVRRVADTAWCWQRQGDVNHITGDVHFVALGLDPRRTIVTVHDCYALERLQGYRRWLLKELWFRLPLQRLAAITVISSETKQQLLHWVQGLREERIHVIPNCVPEWYKPSPKSFNAERPVVLHLGSTRNKNLPRLIEALHGIPCQLRIIGYPSDQDRALLHRYGLDAEVSSGLSAEEVYAAYCEADLVAFVSTYEGFGMPIVEANAVGRPVITSRVSSMPEVAGPAACLVDPFDVDSIRAGIMTVIKDEGYRKELVENGFRNVQRFNLKNIAAQYLKLYTEIGQNRDEIARS